jgi:low temperature requirement protein LtrA
MVRHEEDETAKVTPLELFFDLVFVYAFTQVTAMMAADVSLLGVARGLVVLALVWWCWVGYSWLGNVAQADEGVLRGAFFVVMIAMFILALTIPESFDDLRGGLSADVVFAVCYFVVMAMHVGLFTLAGRDDPGLRRQVAKFAGTVAATTALLLVGTAVPVDWQLPLWAAALAASLIGTIAIGHSGWRLPAADHFAERHGLVIIIALGESIVAIGVGVSALPISWPIIFAAAIGLLLSAGMWWLYFDVIALVAEHRLTTLQGSERVRLARGGFSYLHLPMIAGIVLAALGLKKTFEYVGGADGHSWTDSLHGVAAWALPVGVCLYILGQVAFRHRLGKPVMASAVVAAGLVLVAGVLGTFVPVTVALAFVTAVVAGLVAWETLTHLEVRDALRHEHHRGDEERAEEHADEVHAG